MLTSIKVSARNADEAIAKALEQLKLTRDDVSVEILERGRAGFLGIGACDAVVRVSYEGPDAPVEPAPAKPSAPVEKAPAAKSEDKPAPSAPKARARGEQAEQAETFLRGLLEKMGVQAEMEISARDNGGLDINLSGEGIGAVIGRRGETLDAIQHLTNYAVNRGSDKRGHINVDAENYRAKREASLVRLAEKMAAKVIKYRRSMALEPMNSYERHIIHTALQDYEGVTTSSTGTEPNRRVVVSYARADKAERPERTDRPYRSERPSRGPRTDRPARPAYSKPAAPAAEPAENEEEAGAFEIPEPVVPVEPVAAPAPAPEKKDSEYKEWC